MQPETSSTLTEKIREFQAQTIWVIHTTYHISPPLLLGILITSLLSNLLPAGLAWVGKQIVDSVAGLLAQDVASDYQAVLPWLLLGFGATVSAALLNTLSTFLKQRLTELLVLRLSNDILEHSAELDLAQLEDLELQDVFERVRKNPAGHFSNFLARLISMFAGIIQMISLAAVLAAVEPLILAVLLPILLPYIYSKWRHSQEAYYTEYSRATKRRWASYFISTLTSRNSAPEAKVLGLAPTLIRQYDNLLNEFIREDRRLFLRRSLMELAYALILGVVSYLLMARIVGEIVENALTIGDLTLFIAVSARLSSSLNTVAEAASGAVAELLYIADLNLFFQIQPGIRGRNLTPVRELSGDIEYRHVSFTYPGSESEVIHDVSFKINAGETVAFVGENGAGKTTLVKLLARLYEPTAGSIMVDGVDITSISPKDLHKELAFVLQGFNRYEATVYDNIAYGNIRQEYTEEDLDKIVEATGIRGLIQTMPQGYDTMLGRRFGVYDLSAGMWQKIALARAFTRPDAPILILDEPTAALDARAEFRLFQQFASLAKGRTAILISHRFSTVRLADRIIVLSEGNVLEMGTHDELLSANGRYAELYNLQLLQLKG